MGFAREGGNRYGYRMSTACAVKEDRSTATPVRDTTGLDTCVTVDLFKFSSMTLLPTYAAGSADPGTAGVINAASCPTCDFIGTAGGDRHAENKGIYSWYS